MSKRKLIYSSRVAKAITVEVPEFDWTPMKVTNTFTRRDTGGTSMEKPAKGVVFDPKAEDTRVFVVIDAEDQKELYIKEIGVLNASEGWLDSIIINGDSFEVKDGVEVRSIGKALEFRVA